MIRTEVTLAGKEALEVLLAHRSGHVLSSHDSGVYCRFAPEAIVLIHQARYGEIPFGLAVPDMPPGRRFPPRATVIVEQENSLLLLEDSAFHYGRAASYRSGLTKRKRPVHRNRFAEAVSFLAQCEPHSLASRYAARMDDLFSSQSSYIHSGDFWENALWNPVRDLFTCASGTLRGWPARSGAEPEDRPPDGPAVQGAKAAVLSLLGLGPGLTPLGDDILVGYIYALHRFSGTTPELEEDRILSEIAPVLLKYCWGKTSAQSAVFLQSAAEGKYFGMLEACVACLVQGRAPSSLQPFTSLSRVGNSSGSALALGILGAAQRMLRKQDAFA